MSIFNKQSALSRVNKRKKRKKILQIVLVILTVFFLSIAVLVGYASWKIDRVIDKASDPNDKAVGASDQGQKKNANLEDNPFALLIIGEDYRVETGSRNTDALIVSIWNPENEKITLLSIPRDTKVTLPDNGDVKINSVYAKGEIDKHQQERNGEEVTTSGAQLLMSVVSELLDIPVEHYVKLDFKGFEAVIDELGGIPMDVERDMVYYSAADNTNINLKKGFQTLNGKEALDYARFRRSNDGNDSSDFERNDRQQKIIKAVVDKIISFTGISKIFTIIDIAGEHLKTNLSSDEVKGIFTEYKGIRKDDLISLKMESYWKNPFVYVDQDELIRIQEELKKALDPVSDVTQSTDKDLNSQNG